MAKVKISKADVLRSYGITTPSLLKAGFTWLRYKQPPEKGIYWYYFALSIRQRDIEKYGRCISCDRPITLENCDAGHFMPAANCGRDLLFDERNVNAECSSCNAFDETHLLGYAEGLDRRYGPGTAMELRERRDRYRSGQDGVVKDWKAKEYDQMIRTLPTYPQE